MIGCRRLRAWTVVLGLGLAMLGGCAAPPSGPSPVPTPVAPGPTPPAPEAPAAPPSRPQAEVIRPGPETGEAVRTLLADASRAERQGNLAATESMLERALHIEPRNALLWHYMARLRLHQDRPGQARNLAAKSLSLAQGDVQLQVENWRLIALASAALGDQKAAREAQLKVQALQHQ